MMPAARNAAADRLHAYRVGEIVLTDFRNYQNLKLAPAPRAIALCGDNGSGKTNLLEAISLLAPGRGLRGAALGDMVRLDAAQPQDTGGFTVFARLDTPHGEAAIGTGVSAGDDEAAKRQVRINGSANVSQNDLADHCRMVWLTPAMDGLFTGPGGERRRFLDRLTTALDPAHRRHVSAFETAMRQRNALLGEGAPDSAWLSAIEAQMAEQGVALAAGRLQCVRQLQGVFALRGRDDPFPAASLVLEGDLEAALDQGAALDVEDRYRAVLAGERARDAAAGRTLSGPHRSDMIVIHAPKNREARLCSTGEQKILLVGLVLAHASLVCAQLDEAAPLVLLDEVAAHLDERHRQALFEELAALGAQAWMTGTDEAIFSNAGAQIYRVGEGRVTPAS